MKTANEPLTEKVSVNINTSTLAAIDLLVDNGYYSNRSDFINQSLRETIQRNEQNISRCSQLAGEHLSRGQWFMGVYVLTREEVEKLCRHNDRISITGYGLLRIDASIPEEQLYRAVERISVKGRVSCPPYVREHYELD